MVYGMVYMEYGSTRKHKLLPGSCGERRKGNGENGEGKAGPT